MFKRNTLIFLLFSSFISFSQTEILNLSKSEKSEFKLDGILSESELNNAIELDVKYEHDPGYNDPPSYKTIGYLKYSDTFLYVGFRSYKDNVTASIHSRDNPSLYQDDIVMINLDTYGDARNNLGFTSNLYGSQSDGVRVEGTSYTGQGSGWGFSRNFDFESLGRITDFGYEVEFIIPFAEIPFPNGIDQEWKIKLATYYRDINKQGARARVFSSKQDRENTCQLCQMDHTIVMRDIKIEKGLNFLPYVSSNISGERLNYDDDINYSSPKYNYGIGFNFELNKNLLIEGTINPDFSQVEADATKIDVNSPTAINYPEQRPFFNKGSDVMDYSLDVFYSRSINNPSFASKILNQGRKSRLYVLSAFDDETPYIVPTQFESFSGVGGKSFSNILRYQNFINSNSQLGLLASNRFYEGDAYGNLFGIDGLFKFSNIWKFEFEFFVNSNKEPDSDWIDSDKKFGKYTVALDGEKLNGTAFFAQIRRETETWRSYIEYTNLSDGFRSDLGFITTNNLRKYTLWHSFHQFPDKKIIKNYRISLRHDFELNHFDELARSNFQGYLNFKTIANTDVLYNYEYNFLKSHLDFQFKDFINHWLRVSSRPSNFINFSMFYKFGKDIAYREGKLGMTNNINFSSELTITDNFRVKPSINYSSIKKLTSNEYFFKGFITRLDLRYQFNNEFDLRFISEYNDFSEQFFFQPLISWRPNPDTIFYFGGNQNYIDAFQDYNSPHYRVNKTQIFLKFQYLIKS